MKLSQQTSVIGVKAASSGNGWGSSNGRPGACRRLPQREQPSHGGTSPHSAATFALPIDATLVSSGFPATAVVGEVVANPVHVCKSSYLWAVLLNAWRYIMISVFFDMVYTIEKYCPREQHHVPTRTTSHQILPSGATTVEIFCL